MSTKIILFSLLFLFFTIFISCDTSEPNIDKNNPPGYQDEILWTTLAQSPWPRYHCNSQNNGRTQYIGPQIGNLFKSIEIETTISGIVIGTDSNIYFNAQHTGMLYSMSDDGILNWKTKITDSDSSNLSEILMTPIIDNEGTIYAGLFQEKKLIAIDKTGEIKWELNTGEITLIANNIGLDELIYYLDSSGKLGAVNRRGELVWSLQLSNLTGSQQISFSPDGNTLYVNGGNPSITAVDIVNRKVKWSYGNTRAYTSVVDSYGNVYSIIKRENENKISDLICLSSEGIINWSYPLYNWVSSGYQDPTIDKLGNIYCASDTLYSISYKGELNWKKSLGNFNFSSSILCDGLDNIIITGQNLNSGSIETFYIDKDGNVLWNTPISSGGIVTASGAIGYDNTLYIIVDDYPSKLLIIK